MSFVPDYTNILDAVYNKQPKRIPLYEHNISDEFMENLTGKSFRSLINGDENDKKEYFRHYCAFFKDMGYDTVSFEQCITSVLPGAGALYKQTEPAIKDRADFEKYPWDEIEDSFFQSFQKNFEVLGEMIPDGMKAFGGPGNGLFEIVQDLVGYQELCFLSVDDPDLYRDLFVQSADIMKRIWKRFLDQFTDTYCVCRFGDDLGFGTQTLIPERDIKQHLIPRYKEIVSLIHDYNKPFLLHSCGCIFGIMDDLINTVKIDAKHSNEDTIAPFKKWIDLYGEKIGNFGGIDVGILCERTREEIAEYVKEVYHNSVGHGGFAIGSGNSIPEYVPVDGFLAMVDTVRSIRE